MSLTCITSLCTPQPPKPSRIPLSKPSYTFLLNPAFWTRDMTKTRVRGGAACRSAFELNVVFPEAQPKARTVTPEHSQMPIRMWFLRNWLRLETSIASEATRTRLADASSGFRRGARAVEGHGPCLGSASHPALGLRWISSVVVGVCRQPASGGFLRSPAGRMGRPRPNRGPSLYIDCRFRTG